MKRTAQLVLTALFLGNVAACASDPEFMRQCVDEDGIRAEDATCPDKDGNGGHAGHRWFYTSSTHGVGHVGSKVDTSKGSFVKPGGSIGSVSRGGFGGRVSGGSGS